tara:strand:- start:178 stop:384 length:207 start_codon:yes stop_codon:yes gene_type:complete
MAERDEELLSDAEWVKKRWSVFMDYFDKLSPERQEELTRIQAEFEAYQDEEGEWRLRRLGRETEESTR